MWRIVEFLKIPFLINTLKPEVVEAERKKQADAKSKIASLKEGIASLKK